MSWSLSGSGKPAALKARLQSQFEQAKRNTVHIAHEAKAVELAEQIVNGELDFLAEQNVPAVTVSASGSANTGNSGYPGSSQIALTVAPIYGFVE